MAAAAALAGWVTATDCVFGRMVTCGKVALAVLLTCDWFTYKSKCTHHFRCLRVCGRLCGQWKFRANIGEVPDATRVRGSQPCSLVVAQLVLKETAQNLLAQHAVSRQRFTELAEVLHFLTISSQ